MKTICNKIKINYYTYIFVLLSLLAGYTKNILIIFLIVFVHEFGHVIFFKLFKVKIQSITFYPFGGITKVEKEINFPIIKELIIAIGGILAQILLLVVFNFLKRNNVISLEFFNTFLTFNTSLAFFNLLPIIPLDGSIIIRSIFDMFYPYCTATYFCWSISILSLGIFSVFFSELLVNNLALITFLIYKLKDEMSNFKYVYNKFLLERTFHDFKYRKIVNEKDTNLRNMRKECFHFFKTNDKIISEKTLLNKIFDNNCNI